MDKTGGEKNGGKNNQMKSSERKLFTDSKENLPRSEKSQTNSKKYFDVESLHSLAECHKEKKCSMRDLLKYIKLCIDFLN